MALSICAADLGRAWLGLLTQAKNLATLDTGVGWLDTAVNTVTHSYIDLAGGKPVAGVLCLGYNWYDRYHNNVCELGNNQWWAVADTVNLTLGDVLGYTALLEGGFGVDRATLELLSKEERWLRGVTGGLQLGMSIVAGAELLHNLSPAGIRETGANAEQSAIRMLERKGYSELQPLKNSSGHGIDIVGKNSPEEWRFF